MLSLEKNPAQMGMPEMARTPTPETMCVNGMDFRSPPIWRTSCSSCSAWITAPAARNSSALKNAWVSRWNTPAV